MKSALLAIFLLPLACGAQEGKPHFIDFIDPQVPEAIRTNALQIIRDGRIKFDVDDIDFSGHASSPSPSLRREESDYLCLDLFAKKGKKPTLALCAIHVSPTWIFMHTASFRFGTNVVRLKNPRGAHNDVMLGIGVFEAMSWAHSDRDVQIIIKAIMYSPAITCRLDGRNGDRLVSVDDATRNQFKDMMTVYFAFGGLPLVE